MTVAIAAKFQIEFDGEMNLLGDVEQMSNRMSLLEVGSIVEISSKSHPWMEGLYRMSRDAVVPELVQLDKLPVMDYGAWSPNRNRPADDLVAADPDPNQPDDLAAGDQYVGTGYYGPFGPTPAAPKVQHRPFKAEASAYINPKMYVAGKYGEFSWERHGKTSDYATWSFDTESARDKFVKDFKDREAKAID